MKTELVWEGKYDEYGRRRSVDVAGAAMPMQKIETVDMPRSEALASGQTTLGELSTTVREDFRNRLIWGDSCGQSPRGFWNSWARNNSARHAHLIMTSSSRPNSRRAVLMSSISSSEASDMSTATFRVRPLRTANFDKILL